MNHNQTSKIQTIKSQQKVTKQVTKMEKLKQQRIITHFIPLVTKKNTIH
jgi:hypothetical protein